MLIPDEQVAWLRFAGSSNAAAEVNRRIEAGLMSRGEAAVYAAGVVEGMAALVASGEGVRAARDMLRDALTRFEVGHAAALADTEGRR